MIMYPILASGWSIGSMLQAATETLGHYGSIIITLVGVAMIIVSIYQIAKNLISHGKGQTNWVVTFALLIVGGAFAATGGWALLGGVAQGAQKTLDDMGQGNADTNGSSPDVFNG